MDELTAIGLTQARLFYSLYNFYLGFEARVSVRPSRGSVAGTGRWIFTMRFFPVLYDLYWFKAGRQGRPSERVEDTIALPHDYYSSRLMAVGYARPYVIWGLGTERVWIWEYPRRYATPQFVVPDSSFEIAHSEYPSHLSILPWTTPGMAPTDDR